MRVREKVSPWPFVGMGALACAFFLYAAAWTFAPWWVVVLNLVVWLVAFVVATRWWTPRPMAVAVLGGGVIAWWFVVYLGGGLYLW
ncbi:hypothetical protein BJ980_003671 [Nocardioides daedukensis]|uniref:DUF4175 domain-containing protein n=1 Tax=Nocardioides daedukensis TaxID=634462 RepID=A0A7Y9UQK5_9ACTN|nr:hypothetical protein [Nocardioides daedukensis]NYG60748.1 hypothetical protein [Nocardioides daedukensis]